MLLKSLVFLAIIFNMSCAHKFSASENCNHRDWYELGRQDGSKGAKTAAFNHHARACKMIKKEVVSLYKNGRTAGLSVYCQPQNAFEMGRLNQSYNFVCPRSLERAFINSYKQGKASFIKEQSSKNDLDNEKIVQ
jgi:hypothetical protein